MLGRNKGTRSKAEETETFEEREETRRAATTGVLETAELASKAQERVWSLSCLMSSEYMCFLAQASPGIHRPFRSGTLLGSTTGKDNSPCSVSAS